MQTTLERPVTDSIELPPESQQRRASLSCLIHAEERMFGDLLTSLLSIRAGITVRFLNGKPVPTRDNWAVGAADLLVLVVPPRMPETSLELAARFVQTSPRGRVIALTGPGREFVPPNWLASRIAAIIDRNEPMQHLWNVLDDLLGTPQTVPANGLRSRLGGRSLSGRESEIFQLIGDGLTNNEIAEQLQLSSHTVRTHRKRIAAKLGTEGAELTRWAILSRQRVAPGVDGE